MVLEIIRRFDSQTSSVFCFLLSRPVGGGSAEEVKPLLVFLSLMLNHHLIPQNAHFTVAVFEQESEVQITIPCPIIISLRLKSQLTLVTSEFDLEVRMVMQV